MLLGNKEREALQSGEKIFILVFHMGLHPCEQRISISINKMHIQGITRALKFTPDIKFVNDETLNEFVVTVERRNVGETDAKNDRYSDREDRDKRDEEDRDNSLSSKCIEDKRDEEDRDNSLSSKCIENNEAAKGDNDGVEETEDGARVVRTPYKQLPNVLKDIIHFCAIPRTPKEIMDHIGYYNNSKNMTTYVRPLLEMGYLEMTEPEKPQSKNQKYRKVRKNYKQSICN